MAAFCGAAVVGLLGGMIGLGGAEFRLPLLIGLFRLPRPAGGDLEQGDELGRGVDRAAGAAGCGALQRAD
jgi:hypothetical protein